jgi:hypothetical protein
LCYTPASGCHFAHIKDIWSFTNKKSFFALFYGVFCFQQTRFCIFTHIKCETPASGRHFVQKKRLVYAKIFNHSYPQLMVLKNLLGTILHFHCAHADFGSVYRRNRNICHEPDLGFRTRHIFINKNIFLKPT